MKKTMPIIATMVSLFATTVHGIGFEGGNAVELIPTPAPQADCAPNAAGGSCEIIYPNSLVKVLEVSQTFQRNEAAADANFTEKSLVFSGRLVRIVRSLDKDGQPIYAAELSPDGKPAKNYSLAFHFPKADRDQLRCLSVGDHVRFQGVCIGVVTEDAAPPVPGLPPAPPRSEIQFNKCKLVQ